MKRLEDCYDLLKEGEKNRHYASTRMNHQSSRSHTVFRVNLVHRKIEEAIEQTSILNFIDLAGSESISVHDRDPKESGDQSPIDNYVQKRKREG